MIMTTSTTKAACPTNSPKGPVPVTPRSNETRPGHTTRLPQKTRPGHTTRLSQTNSPKGSVTVTLRTRSKERCSQVRPHEFKTGPHSKLRRANWRPLLWPTTTMTAALLLLTLSPVTGAGEKFMTWDFNNKMICRIKKQCPKCEGKGRLSKTDTRCPAPDCHRSQGYVLTDTPVKGQTMEWINANHKSRPRPGVVGSTSLNGTEYNIKRYFSKDVWNDGFNDGIVRFFLIPKSYNATPTENPGKGRRRLTGQEILDLRPRRKNSAEVVLGALLEEITRR